MNVCDIEPVGPTVTSVRCRLDGLRVQAAGVSIGKSQAKELSKLDRAIEQLQQAMDDCAGDSLKRARKRLKKVAKAVASYGRRLKTRSARKGIGDEARRMELIAEGKSLKADVKALRRALSCPQDATGAPPGS